MKRPQVKLSIAAKIVSGFMAVLVLLGAVSWISIGQVSKVDWAYTDLLKRRDLVIENVRQLKAEVVVQEKAIRGLLLTGDAQHETEYKQSLDAYNESFEQFAATAPNEAAKKQINGLKLAYEHYRGLLDGIVDLQRTNKGAALETYQSKEVKEAAASFDEHINGILTVAKNTMDKDQNAAALKTDFIIKMLIGATAVAVLLGLAISLVISRFISRPVTKVSRSMSQLANGDFSIEPIVVKNRDEIGDLVDSMNRMVQDLGGILSKVSESGQYLAASAEELSASSEQNKTTAGRVAHISQQSASGAERQLASFQETTARVDEIAAEIERISSSSEEMRQAAVSSAETTKRSVASINDVVAQMNEIDSTTQRTKEIIRTLENHSNNISAVVALITGIAEQTNLLALNAAIEAARAGEQGKGFGVVAGEIRKLAEGSRRSAEDVVGILELIQQGTKQAAASMERENELVAAGLASTYEAKDAFAEIDAAMDNVAEQVRELSVSVEGIKDFSKQIANEIEHSAKISEEGLHLAQESSAASEQQLAATSETISSVQNLAQLADDMQRQIARFKF